MGASEPLWARQSEGRFFTRIELTTMLNGGVLALPLHVVTGARPGPTLGLIAGVHGDEFLPTIAVRQLLAGVDTARLAGRLVVVSVANPLAAAAFGRLSAEPHGRTDLNEVFPGNPCGNATQMIAAAISEHVIGYADALIDFHSGGSGGRLQARADYDANAADAVKRSSRELARAFGAPFVHENDLTGTAAHHANCLGKPAFNPELGGSYLGPDHTALYTRQAIEGLTSVMRALGMLEGSVRATRPLHFGLAARCEIRPRASGYLVSRYQRPTDLGRIVPRGAKLGELVDHYSYRVLEDLSAPCEGYLFFSRYSGLVAAGTQAFGLAEAARCAWLD